MDPATLTAQRLRDVLARIAGPNTRKVSDYLAGRQLGPQRTLITGTASEIAQRYDQQDVSYWGGDLLKPDHPKFGDQVTALRKSFTFRNVTLEGVEMLADGVGADAPDWKFTPARVLKDQEKPSADELALITELEGILTAWWDARDIPEIGYRVLVNAIAHQRQPVRYRIPDRFKGEGGLTVRPAEQSLDGLFVEVPELVDSGVVTDPVTLEEYGVTRIEYPGVNSGTLDGYEVTYLNDAGETVLASLGPDGVLTEGDALDLGGQLWLKELRFRRGVVTDDVLSLQTARNVATTNLTRNTRWAAFEKTIAIGIDPPTDENGKVLPLSGPGAESYLQPAAMREVEEGSDSRGQPTNITRERMYPGASVTKLDPSDPKAITAAIAQADEDLYSAMRQRFMLTAASDASGRKSEISAGPFLRATARYAATMEAFYRDVLMFAARISAITQGQPGRYDTLRPVVTCKPQVFEPSPEMITAYLALHTAGVWSMQTTRAATGRSDPDAEQAQVDKERAAAPPPTPASGGPNDPAQ